MMTHALASSEEKVHVSRTKTKPHSIFVGYFPVSIPLANLVSFLKSKCRDVQSVSVGRVMSGSDRGRLVCRVDFDNRAAAPISMNILSGMRLADLQLVARPWAGRTEANERRDVDWRQKSWKRQERRLRERRNNRISIDEVITPDSNVFWYRQGENALRRRDSD